MIIPLAGTERPTGVVYVMEESAMMVMVNVPLWVSSPLEVSRVVKLAWPVAVPAVTVKVQTERVTVILASAPDGSPQVMEAGPSEA